MHPELREFEITRRVREAPGVVTLTLVPLSGETPPWQPGAHVDIDTPAGLRQYSLCGEAGSDWQISVQRAAPGRGGSEWVHEQAHPGARLRVSAPRNTFEFHAGAPALFIAGGIGITPLLPLAEQCDSLGTPYRLVYSARSASQHAFGARIDRLSERTRWNSGTQGRLPIDELLEDLSEDAVVYCCGPQSMIDDIERIAAARGRSGQVRTERFTANSMPRNDALSDAPFTCELRRSGIQLTVPGGLSMLEALGGAGAFVVSSCRQGLCGSCEVGVISGRVDHRDSLLTQAEREAHDCMLPCVSRALPGEHLVIDL